MSPNRAKHTASPVSGRHLGRRVGIGIAAAAVLTALAVVGVSAVRASTGSDASGCAGGQLRIAATPEIAPVLSGVVQVDGAQHDDCRDAVLVVPAESADVAARLARDGSQAPDVWVPDSSVWIHRTLPDATQAVSLASSPLTVAIPAAVAKQLHPDGRPVLASELLPAAPGTAGPVRWVLPEPRERASGVGALLGLEHAVAADKQKNALLATIIRASRDDAPSLTDLASSGERAALPVSEQQFYDFNATQPTRKLVAAYPGDTGFRFDYPYVVLNPDQQIEDRARRLLERMQGDLGRRLLEASGFRSADGVASPDLMAAAGLSAPEAFAGQSPRPDIAAAVTEAYEEVTRPSRLLALIDVSGSMKSRVPGAGGATRIQLAVQAAVNGLAVYPDETAVGLWVFSTNLTPKTDYRELVAVAPLGRGPDGISGRERMARGLAQVKIAKGKSGVYDSTLAAVRRMRSTWDPDRVNSVVVISDGANVDPGGISLDDLLATLERESDPARPVAVFGIAYGPSGDLESLSKISSVTGGKAYAAPDPRQISQVLRDAIGRRTCAPNCR
jgi:von Willebrand factor type A domain